MKANTLKTIGFALVGFAGFTACNGLGKMVKKAKLVTYTLTPNPLQLHGDSVAVAITGKYPEKYFGKKVTLTFTPTIKWSGGEKELKPIVIVGEKVTDAKGGKTINYKTGGSFTYTDKVAYQPELRNCEVFAKAKGTVKSAVKIIPEAKLGDGTIVTPLLVQKDELPMLAKDNFVKIVPKKLETEIFFLINQSVIRPSETKGTEIKELKDFITNNGNNSSVDVKGMSVSAYASPDGELSLNEHLAEDRAKSSVKYFQSLAKDKKSALEAAQKDEFYQTVTTAEDWAGFEKAMQESTDIPDKDLILNVLKMYPDGEIREKEIKNLSKTYTEVAEKILPKLRRSVNTLNYEVKGRSDEAISSLAVSTPDSLSVEEIIYAGTLTTDLNAKANIYKAAAAKYSQDWRTLNNLGVSYLTQNKVEDAKTQFDKANQLSANNPIILNNMGICAEQSGDRKAAMEYYKKITSAGAETKYNMGIIDIKDGNYSSALSNFGDRKTFNVALANLLSGNFDSAIAILNASKTTDDAISYYLRAIAGARSGKADVLTTNLKTAISKDASLKDTAKTDMEFLKFRDNADFKAAVN